MSTDSFKNEYNPKTVSTEKVSGFDFNITPRFKHHFVDTDKPYEWLTIKVFNTLSDLGSQVLDVGAHYGFYTLNAAREVGKFGKVVAVEPIKFNNNLLNDNVRQNGFSDRVVILNNPVSNEEKKVQFNITEASDNSGFYNHPNTRVIEKINATSVTIDGIVKKYGLKNLSTVKIDAEGHECEILDGAKSTLVEQKPVLFLEYNPKCLIQAGRAPEDMFTVLSAHGYVVIFIDDMNDRFIYAKSPSKSWTKFVNEKSYMNVIAIPRKQQKSMMEKLGIFGKKIVKY